MQSSNFQPLKEQWPQLYEHAAFAESYVYSDPDSAVIKLRCFAELLVGSLYKDLQLPSAPSDNLLQKLQADSFLAVVGSEVGHKLHAIRMWGNKAAHGKKVGSQAACSLLKEAFLIGQWFHKTYSPNVDQKDPIFVLPPEPAAQSDELSKTTEQLARQLEAARAELAQLEASEKAALAEIRALNKTLDQVKLEAFKISASRAAARTDFQPEKTRCLISIHDAFAEYTLNKGQAELIEHLDAFLSDRQESVFLLKGYAGTGKTFITKGLTEYLQSIGRNYILAAPTGKASKVIARKTRSPAYTVHKTIYSFKDIAEYRDGDVDGTETYKFYAQLKVNEFSADTVFIVDEASMLADVNQEAEFFRFGSGYLLEDFLKFANLDHNDHHKKVIFIGDDAQLPPVGMNFSPALDSDYLYHKHHVRSMSYELTEVVRQESESGVMRNSLKLRKSLKAGVFDQLNVELDYPDISRVEHADLMDKYLKSCGGKINGDSVVIAGSNADVADYNREIRKHFFPECQTVAPNDKVLAVSNSNAYGFFISNGDVGLVREVLGEAECRSVTLKRKNPATEEVEKICVPLRFRDVIAEFRDLEDRACVFRAKIMEDLLYSKNPTLTSDESKALYLDFCIRNSRLQRGSLEFKQTLMSDPYFNALRLKFGYAITCHKAQGSEWKHVFVKCRTNQSQLSAGYFRWFYTAITRTAGKLYLLDPPSSLSGTGLREVFHPFGVSVMDKMRQDSYPCLPAVSDEETNQLDPPVEQDLDTLGIPASAAFQLAVLHKVRGLLAGTGTEIDFITHNPYQEAYFFKRGKEFSRVNVGYGKKGNVTALDAHPLSELSCELLTLLEPLKRAMPPPTAAAEQNPFPEPFLNEFHHRLSALAAEQGMAIQNVLALPWCQRYSFTRDGEVAVYDFWYNGRSQFKKFQRVMNASSSGSLVADVGALLTEKMSR